MNLENRISDWLKNYLESNNLECFVVGVSGGIDSAVTSTLCGLTGKPTILLSLPINQEEHQLSRANEHIEWLQQKCTNVRSIKINLTYFYQYFENMFIDDPNKLALANSRSRLRMTTLYQVAQSHSGLVVGTGNKVEDFGIGFFTKYGDGGVDISPIADLTKTEVKQLAKKLDIIPSIIEAPPTDGLWEDNRTDEDQIGASYEELEKAMEYTGDPNLLEGREKEVYYIYKNLNTKNKHKMIPIPVFKK